MCSAPKPKVTHSPPPPMALPVVDNPNTVAAQRRQRQLAAAASGRDSTILGGAIGNGAAVGGPTGQQKTLLGS